MHLIYGVVCVVDRDQRQVFECEWSVRTDDERGVQAINECGARGFLRVRDQWRGGKEGGYCELTSRNFLTAFATSFASSPLQLTPPPPRSDRYILYVKFICSYPGH